MEKVELSHYLSERRPVLKECRDLLMAEFDFVSFLGTDTQVLQASVDNMTSGIRENRWVERGFVCRVQKEGLIWEYSFNQIPQQNAQALADEILQGWKSNRDVLENLSTRVYLKLDDPEWKEEWCDQVQINTFRQDPAELIEKMKSIHRETIDKVPFTVYGAVIFMSMHISKIFISEKRDLAQSYMNSEGYLIAQLRKGKQNRELFRAFSGQKGSEVLDEYRADIPVMAELAEPLLNAESLKPGEYDVILGPDVSGVLAHEAFGHGVETDTFVKNRALAVQYLGKPVASELVNMHDGAKGVKQVSSYLFDDEGNPGTDQLIIEKGILKGGIGDELSQKILKLPNTGNGKRESYKRKSYARMTNTWFEPGKDNLEEMIASVEHGYLLDTYYSGMEDPKNWGIQIAAAYGKEIENGKLTGKMVAPVFMTGFVPDVLKQISMVSDDLKLGGSGYCGKGYKEFVKTSTGGPYLKTRMRLG